MLPSKLFEKISDFKLKDFEGLNWEKVELFWQKGYYCMAVDFGISKLFWTSSSMNCFRVWDTYTEYIWDDNLWFTDISPLNNRLKNELKNI
jgi:hypothetical protein